MKLECAIYKEDNIMDNDRNTSFKQSTYFLRYCNSKLANSNEYNIAKVIIDNIHHASNLSLEYIANNAHISTASVSRFINKTGFRSFQEFKNCMENAFLKTKMRRMDYNSKRFMNLTDEDFLEALYTDAIENLKKTRINMDLDKIKEIVQKLKESRSVTFLGDFHELAIFYTLQLELFLHNVPAYLMSQEELNMLHVHTLNQGDIVFLINIYDEWFTDQQKEMISVARNNGASIIAFCQDDIDLEKEDVVYRYGVEKTNNDGYFSLLYLNRIMCELFYR